MTKLSIDKDKRNNENRCAYCGIPITPSNDSGWEVFVDKKGTTQPICGVCEVEMYNKEGKKAE